MCILFSKEAAPWPAAHCILSFRDSNPEEFGAITQESKKAQRKVSPTETWISWFLCLDILISLSWLEKLLGSFLGKLENDPCFI